MLKIDNLNNEESKKILSRLIPHDVIATFEEIYNIKSDKISTYYRDGFVKVENVLSGKALQYANEVISAAVYLRKEEDKRTLQQKSEYEKSFLQCGYLCWDFDAVKKFVLARRFGSIAKQLMQVEYVRLWHDQALFKEPGGNPTAIHQDCSYWPIASPENTTTMWLALEDVTVDMGSLCFYAGTHDKKLQEYVDIFKNPHVPDSLKNKNKISVDLKAGDATFHSGLLFHGAGSNQTKKLRKGMTVIYVSDGNRFDASDERNAAHTSCQGLKHGDVINTKYTPIII